METEALKQSILENTVTSIVRHVSSFVAIVKSVLNFSATLEKEHVVSFLAIRILEVLKNIVSSAFFPAKALKHISAISE